MIIDDFNFFRPGVRPTKADSPLVVDPNAVLARAIPFERLKVIAGRNVQIIQAFSDFKLSEFASRDFGKSRELSDMVAF